MAEGFAQPTQEQCEQGEHQARAQAFQGVAAVPLGQLQAGQHQQVDKGSQCAVQLEGTGLQQQGGQAHQQGGKQQRAQLMGIAIEVAIEQGQGQAQQAQHRQAHQCEPEPLHQQVGRADEQGQAEQTEVIGVHGAASPSSSRR
ncbi:hypothetical protein D3C84_459960 [compost metagenome]